LFTELNPEIEQSDTWDPLQKMIYYLENKNLREEEIEAILDDHPMPNCLAMKVLRIDEQVKKQLKSKGKRLPHAGETLFNTQEKLLKIKGPLNLFAYSAYGYMRKLLGCYILETYNQVFQFHCSCHM